MDPVWNIHELISNVALAAVEWDWLKMRLVDPIWKKIEKEDVKEITNHELHKIITNADNVYFKSKYLKKIWHKLSYNGRKAKILNSKNGGLVVIFQENGEYKWEKVTIPRTETFNKNKFKMLNKNVKTVKKNQDKTGLTHIIFGWGWEEEEEEETWWE